MVRSEDERSLVITIELGKQSFSLLHNLVHNLYVRHVLLRGESELRNIYDTWEGAYLGMRSIRVTCSVQTKQMQEENRLLTAQTCVQRGV